MPKFYLVVNGITVGKIKQDILRMLLRKQGMSWNAVGDWMVQLVTDGSNTIGPDNVRVEYR